MANLGPDRSEPFKSIIYKWSKKRKKFRMHQELVTNFARDLEYFQIDGLHYLACANHAIGKQNLDTVTILARALPSVPPSRRKA